MAVYKISGSWVSKDPRKLRKALRDLGVTNPEVTKIDGRPSRASQLADALSDLQRGQEVIIDLRDELQESRDRIPEHREDSEKAERLDTAIETLTAFEEIEIDVEVDFPR